jgi:hypothetical protein
MAGLVPAIHVFTAKGKQDVDARVKPAHDERITAPRSGMKNAAPRPGQDTSLERRKNLKLGS